MKKSGILLLAICMGAFTSMDAQEKGTLGFSFSAFNNNQLLQSAETGQDDITVNGRGFMSFSTDYWYPVNDWLELETGVNYSMQYFRNIYNDPSASEPVDPENDITHMINIPVGVRAGFLKYGFINGGILVDILKEPGIGSYFGVGARIESPVGFGMFINPYVKAHSIFPVNFNKNADRILEAGIRIGVSFRLGSSMKEWR